MKLSKTIDQTRICKKSYDDPLGYFCMGFFFTCPDGQVTNKFHLSNGRFHLSRTIGQTLLSRPGYMGHYTPLAEWWVYWNTLVRPSVRSSVPKPCVRKQSFVFCWILFIFGIFVGHDLSMRILYRFHGWLILARVIALFMFV